MKSAAAPARVAVALATALSGFTSRRPLPGGWIIGAVAGVAVDSQDRVQKFLYNGLGAATGPLMGQAGER
jgi:hypothetical protein